MLSRLLLCAAALLPQAGPATDNPPADTASDAPHIVLIVTDDQRADTIAAWGNPHIRTPHLDALSERGTSFRRAYCLGSRGGAVCVPSRAMIHAGRPYFGLDLAMKEGTPTIGGQLGEAGYTTFHAGKWHNGRMSVRRSFQSGRSIMFSGMSDHRAAPITDWDGEEFSETRAATGHSSEVFADAAIEFLGSREQGAAPFFLSLAFSAPHDPRDPPRPWARPYYAEPPPLPANFMPEHPFDNGLLVLRDEVLAPWPRPRDVVRDQLAEYYGLIEHLDSQIGRVLAAVDALDDGRDVLIVYVADHGLALGSHGLLGKQNLYEHSMRAPMIIAGPGFPAGESTHALTYLTDVHATIGAAAGLVRKTDPRWCRDLGPAARGEEGDPRQALLLAMGKTQRALSNGRWKLIRYPEVDHTQLFDLASDPHELVNLSTRPEHAERVASMMTLLQNLMDHAGDDAPLVVDEPKPLVRDLSGVERKADRWQPRWIREKYFGAR